MGDKTGISWADATWNPIRGCSVVSEGCVNCYAMKMAHRFSGPGQPYENLTKMTKAGPQWNGNIRLVPEMLDKPLRWQRPRRVFVNSMSDLFHESVPFTFVQKVFLVMQEAYRHTFQILTKRPARLLEFWKHAGWGDCASPNIWLGVTAENQKAADLRIPLLLQCPAALRWVSCEPLIGPVELGPGLDWVVAGGESQAGARPCHPDWLRSLRDQAANYQIPFHFKQWGEWGPGDPLDSKVRKCCVALDGRVASGKGNDAVVLGDFPRLADAFDGWSLMGRVGVKRSGHLLDGVEHREFPR